MTELSKHIQVRCSESCFSGENFDFHFPDFVYILRDFSSHLVLNGRKVTASEYLEDSLSNTTEPASDAKDFNRVRQGIKTYFTKRQCFAFVAPKAGILDDLDNVSDNELAPEFVEEASKFVRYINDESRVKSINGRRLTCRSEF